MWERRNDLLRLVCAVKVIQRSLIALSLHLSAVEYGIIKLISSSPFRNFLSVKARTMDLYQAMFNYHCLSFLSALSAVAYVLTLCRATFLETTKYDMDLGHAIVSVILIDVISPWCLLRLKMNLSYVCTSSRFFSTFLTTLDSPAVFFSCHRVVTSF